MTKSATLEQLETLAAQLPPEDQLRLVARISDWLTQSVSLPVTVGNEEAERLRKEREREAAAVLRECDRAAAAFARKTDSVEALRRIRDERHRELCQSE